MTGAIPLIFETSTPCASIALMRADGTGESRSFQSDRNHNAMLFKPLQELLENQGTERVNLVLVGSGPGSYSGTRVGIAAAQGVAIALGCPAVAVPSILAVPAADGGARCMAIGDARRGSFWTARVADFQMTMEPTLCDADGLAAAVADALADGFTVISFEEPARFPLPEEIAFQVKLEFPDAMRLWQAWVGTDEASRMAWTAQIPQPLYLKPPHITPGKRASLMRPG
jgi:tRNA threonylcarbamoyladenosine biosynthesis protein TsaB